MPRGARLVAEVYSSHLSDIFHRYNSNKKTIVSHPVIAMGVPFSNGSVQHSYLIASHLLPEPLVAYLVNEPRSRATVERAGCHEHRY